MSPAGYCIVVAKKHFPPRYMAQGQCGDDIIFSYCSTYMSVYRYFVRSMFLTLYVCSTHAHMHACVEDGGVVIW